MTSQKFKISILLVSYNHEKFIEEAMQSLLLQKFEGQIELVIADDCSTDKTVELIKKYDGLDPRFNFVYLSSPINLGVTRNYQRAFCMCKGEYLAVLEGDDYWISPYKLQEQCEFLDKHLECGMVSSNYFVFNESSCDFLLRIPELSGFRYLTARSMIADNVVGNFSTCMYRTEILDTLPEKLFSIESYDWIINICLARKKLIGFIHEPMSVYRIHKNGVWSQSSAIEKLERQLNVISLYDKITEEVFHLEFSQLQDGLKHEISKNKLHVSKKPYIKILKFLLSCLPPVFFYIAKLLTPQIVYKFVRTKIIGGSNA